MLCKCKSKIYPSTDHIGPEGEKRFNSTLSLTLAVDGVGGQHKVPAALPPGKTHDIDCTGGWVGDMKIIHNLIGIVNIV
jgi:hypothetical protein